jgi:hypothetical protein
MTRTSLSLILCSRNDDYMGDPVWRLQTVLNYTAAQVAALGRQDEVEILVTDWGSAVPLSGAVRLSPLAARMTRFLTVRQELAEQLQGESPFSEVHALNAAARRARGTYIGRIDQDTMVGREFLRRFLETVARPADAPDVDRRFLFAKRRNIPYRFASRCPSEWAVDRYLRWFSDGLKVQGAKTLFYHAAVGIMVMHRGVWWEVGGYDERLVFMNHMEPDLAYRVGRFCALVDLEELTGLDFYHLDHVPAWQGLVRRENPFAVRLDRDKVLNPNGEVWGLAGHSLPLTAADPNPTDPRSSSVEWIAYAGTLLWSWVMGAWDRGLKLLVDLRSYLGGWQSRFRSFRTAARGVPPWQWPALARRLRARSRALRREADALQEAGAPKVSSKNRT